MSKQLVEQCQQGNAFARKRLFDQYAKWIFQAVHPGLQLVIGF